MSHTHKCLLILQLTDEPVTDHFSFSPETTTTSSETEADPSQLQILSSSSTPQILTTLQADDKSHDEHVTSPFPLGDSQLSKESTPSQLQILTTTLQADEKDLATDNTFPNGDSQLSSSSILNPVTESDSLVSASQEEDTTTLMVTSYDTTLPPIVTSKSQLSVSTPHLTSDSTHSSEGSHLSSTETSSTATTENLFSPDVPLFGDDSSQKLTLDSTNDLNSSGENNEPEKIHLAAIPVIFYFFVALLFVVVIIIIFTNTHFYLKLRQRFNPLFNV